MTIDHIDSAIHVPRAEIFSAVSSEEWSEDAQQSMRMWETRGRFSTMPDRQLRVPDHAMSASTLRSSSSTTRRTHTGTCDQESLSEQLAISAHEDIGRLNEILCSLHCKAVIGDGNEAIASANATKSPIHSIRYRVDALLLSAPIIDAAGREFASLDIIQDDAADTEPSAQLLRALVESAARNITERWFRLVHRRQWVVAAMQRNAPGATIMLATDRDQGIVGADRQARRMLEQKGQRMGHQIPISALFRPNPTLLRRRGHCDISTTLFASGDGEPWTVLITPPDAGAMESVRDPRVLLHVRPRQHSLTHASFSSSATRAKRGLSPGALQRIEEHIEAHLDSALEIDELAAMVRMSSSHFTRSFQKSVGVTPHRYVIQNRVSRARELLASTNLALTDIALATGFSDQSHFSRRFHEIVGVPPGAFREHDGSSPFVATRVTVSRTNPDGHVA